MFGVNHGTERLWPISWHVASGRPNQVHRRHPHTMGDDSCAWFGVISSTASAVGSVIKSKKMLRVQSAHQEMFGGFIDGDGGGDGEKKGVKVGTNYIQQSTKAGGGAGRQGRDGTDGGR